MLKMQYLKILNYLTSKNVNQVSVKMYQKAIILLALVTTNSHYKTNRYISVNYTSASSTLGIFQDFSNVIIFKTFKLICGHLLLRNCSLNIAVFSIMTPCSLVDRNDSLILQHSETVKS